MDKHELLKQAIDRIDTHVATIEEHRYKLVRLMFNFMRAAVSTRNIHVLNVLEHLAHQGNAIGIRLLATCARQCANVLIIDGYEEMLKLANKIKAVPGVENLSAELTEIANR